VRVIPLRAALALLYMAGMYAFSELPGSSLARLGWSYTFFDFLHVPLYAGLGVVTLAALVGPAPLRIAAAFAVCAGFGFLDEFHQLYVPGRVFSWSDLGNDALGALLGITLRESWAAPGLSPEGDPPR
jgi:VanZ family protein